MLEITSKEMFTQLMVHDKHYDLIVLDIYADWCHPCKILAPKLQELADQYAQANVNNILFCKANNDINVRTVQGLPTIQFWLKQGKKRDLVHTVVGANMEEIRQTAEKFVPLPKQTQTAKPVAKTSSESSTPSTKNPAIKNTSNQLYQQPQIMDTVTVPKTSGRRSEYKTFSSL